MNLIFLALFDDFASFFNDKVLSNIDTSDLSGSNVRDILKSYFEKILYLSPVLSSLAQIFF